MTGKQLWEHLAGFEAAQRAAVEAASDDDLRRAYGYALGQGDSAVTARLRAQLARQLRRRGLKVPV